MTAIRRNIKNMVHNYSDAKVKVREATSNDPWGPSSTLMAEIAEMTYNVMAYTEIMSMIWKRLNDKNRNWRHVYKALVLLDYLVKSGSEKVAQQCKENLFVVQSLRDFQYVEEAKDHGLNVREKAKQLVALLKDDEKLRAERASALRTRERLHGGARRPRRSGSADFTGDSRQHRPVSFAGEVGAAGIPAGAAAAGGGAEDVELELALAISKEEHAAEQRRREAEGMKDDMRLRMALEASQKEEEHRRQSLTTIQQRPGGGLVDLIDTSLSAAPVGVPDPWGAGPPAATAWSDPWGGGAGAAQQQPQAAGNGAFSVSSADPWSTPATQQQQQQAPSSVDFSDAFGKADDFSRPTALASADPWSAGLPAMPGDFPDDQKHQQQPRAKSVHSFLGDHVNLVNLDSLVTKPKGNTNPFASAAAPSPALANNPFHSGQPAQPTLSELQRRGAHQAGFDVTAPAAGSGSGLPPPLIQPPAPPPQQQPFYPPAYNPWGPPPPPPPSAGGLNPFV